MDKHLEDMLKTFHLSYQLLLMKMPTHIRKMPLSEYLKMVRHILQTDIRYLLKVILFTCFCNSL